MVSIYRFQNSNSNKYIYIYIYIHGKKQLSDPKTNINFEEKNDKLLTMLMKEISNFKLRTCKNQTQFDIKIEHLIQLYRRRIRRIHSLARYIHTQTYKHSQPLIVCVYIYIYIYIYIYLITKIIKLLRKKIEKKVIYF